MCESRSIRSFCFICICSCNLIQCNIWWCISSCGAIRRCDTLTCSRLAKITMPSKLQDRKNHSRLNLRHRHCSHFYIIYTHTKTSSQMFDEHAELFIIIFWFDFDFFVFGWMRSSVNNCTDVHEPFLNQTKYASFQNK